MFCKTLSWGRSFGSKPNKEPGFDRKRMESSSTESVDAIADEKIELRKALLDKELCKSSKKASRQTIKKQRQLQEIEDKYTRVQALQRHWEESKHAWAQTIDLARRRHQAWNNGTEVQDRKNYRSFKFDTKCHYLVDITPVDSPAKSDWLPSTIILDFRTPKGRMDALEWFEKIYSLTMTVGMEKAAAYDVWMEVYLAWKAQDSWCSWPMNSCRRRTLLALKVPEKIHQSSWAFKELPNIY